MMFFFPLFTPSDSQLNFPDNSRHKYDDAFTYWLQTWGGVWTLLFTLCKDLMMDRFNPKHVAKAYEKEYTVCFDW
jgi:hypothetical protein